MSAFTTLAHDKNNDGFIDRNEMQTAFDELKFTAELVLLSGHSELQYQVTLTDFRKANMNAAQAAAWEESSKKIGKKGRETTISQDFFDDFAAIGRHFDRFETRKDAIWTQKEVENNIFAQGEKIPLAAPGGELTIGLCEVCGPIIAL
jgi:hypothetical protein